MADFDEMVRDMFWDKASQACCCMGSQNGEPVCPCAMKYVKIVDGHYIQITDLGKVDYGKFNGVREFNVILTGYLVDHRLKVMRSIRRLIPEIKLSDISRILENTPWTLKQGLSMEEAAELKFSLEEDGAIVELE